MKVFVEFNKTKDDFIFNVTFDVQKPIALVKVFKFIN